MIEHNGFGPEQMPRLPNGEYNLEAVKAYLIATFKKLLDSIDEFGKKQLGHGGVSRDFTLKHVAGNYRYTVTITTDPQYTQYKIEPSVDGDHQFDFENDLFSTVGDIGVYYESITFGFASGGDYVLAIQRIIEVKDLLENQYITEPEKLVEIGNIIKLLEPA